MSELELRAVSKCIGQMLFIDDEDNLIINKQVSLKVSDREKELFSNFLEMGKITADVFIELVKTKKDLDEYDFQTGAEALVKEYEKIKKEFSDYRRAQLINEEEEWANKMCKID